jgi:hypothetical protein
MVFVIGGKTESGTPKTELGVSKISKWKKKIY